MNFQDAIIFLELVKTRNISKAADKLFLSQSTVSTHLKQMETEIGESLFVRGKGYRSLTLTAMGQELIPIAEHIRLAEKRLKLLKAKSMQMLSLASNESFFYEILQPFLTEFHLRHPEIHLSVQVKDSNEVYQLLNKDFVDMGFGSFNSEYSGILAKSLYEQEWSIVSGIEFKTENGKLSPEKLDPEQEIFYSVGDLSAIYQWRQRELGTQFVGPVEFNSFLESLDMLAATGAWEFCTSILAKRFQQIGNYRIYQLEKPPQGRKIYLLEKERREQREAELLLQAELLEYIATAKDIGKTDN